MKKLISLLIFIPLGIVMIILSVANRHPVSFGFDPVNPETPFFEITLPFFVFLFIVLIGGMVLGAMATWWGQGKHRKTARHAKREAARLEKELEEQKKTGKTRPADDTTAEILALTG